MVGPFRAIRADEARDAYTAFAILLGLLASHAVLETARDALFLASIPPERLPLVYVAIAGLSLVLAQLQGRSGMSRKAAVMVWTASAAAMAFLFWLAIDLLGDLGLYALAVWAGLVTTLVLVHFWSLLGDLFTVTQAKRLYGAIGAGSVAGAIAGSGLATALAPSVAPRQLLLVAAGGFFATSLLATQLRDPGTRVDDDEDGAAADRTPLLDGLRLLRQAYPRRIALVVVVSAAALALTDYVFKATVAETVPPEDLAWLFAVVSLVLNAASLISQLGLIGFLLHRFSVSTALAVMPALLLVGTGAYLVVPTLATVLALKGIDGTLKHSLHRTVTELLYVPLREGPRARLKALVDVAGQRGGQTAASLAILLFVGVGLGLGAVALLLAVLVLVWLMLAVELRGPYLALFRERIRDDEAALELFRDLDGADFETLLRALDSDDELEVCAALDVFERQGKATLVPKLILYHPSPVVLERALRLVGGDGRVSVLNAVEALLDHPVSQVRVAAVLALARLEQGVQRLEGRADDEALAGVLTAVRVAKGEEAPAALDEAVERALAAPDPAARTALAEVIGTLGLRRFDLLERLVYLREPTVLHAVAQSLGRLQDPEGLPLLISLLGRDGVQREVEDALQSFGRDVTDPLVDVLDDESRPIVQRSAVPRVLALCLPEAEVALILLPRLVALKEGLLRRRVVTTLEDIMGSAGARLTLDEARLDRAIEGTLGRAYRNLDRLRNLDRGAAADPARRTPGHGLLREWLGDRDDNLRDHLLRLLDLRYPRRDLTEVRRALRGRDPDARSSALELLEAVLSPGLRRPVLALFDHGSVAERVREGAALHAGQDLDYEELLLSMVRSASAGSRAIAAYHIGELGLRSLREPLLDVQGEAVAVDDDVGRALSRLASRPDDAG
ncbi:MAG: HEAT repeat domain-containing protein [Sandaracinaceae bacterium]